MARVETIVVGGGIAAGTPFTLNNFTIVTATDPPQIGDGNIRQDTSTPPKVYVGQSTYTTTSTVLGGAVGNASMGASIAIGEAASVQSGSSLVGSESIVIGPGARACTVNAVGSGTNMVVIGQGATNTTASGAVIVGPLAVISGAGGAGNNAVLIGNGATITAGSSQVVIGTSGNASQSNAVAIGGSVNVTGTSSTAVGNSSSITANSCTVVGFGCTATAANVVNIGVSIVGSVANSGYFGHSNGLSNIVFGKGETAVGGLAVTLRGTNGSGANNAAGAITLQAGLSTGNAASAAVNLAVGIVGASSSTIQTARTGVACSYTATATETYLMVYDVDNATLERVTVGAADSGGVGFKLLRIPN